MSNLRVQLKVQGTVQGVGFRPFIHNMAKDCGLNGWVCNTSEGVVIEAEGEKNDIDDFIFRIDKENPVHSHVQSLESIFLEVVGYKSFEIKESINGIKTALILPDIAMCSECKEEIQDTANRRYKYPFTNCTHCGPRYSIIETLPYDRKNTTMSSFDMCDDCNKEYNDPSNRRFHAQPNACPVCGPSIELCDHKGEIIGKTVTAIKMAATLIKEGNIVAIKGLGGFQLVVDARDAVAVERLRERKNREAKPFAVMYHDIDEVKLVCNVSHVEEQMLCSAQAPIVLLVKKGHFVAENVAPGNPYLGVMLPYTPLHFILMQNLKIPVVATSGNLSEDPICIDEWEAIEDLGSIADYFLIHNRPIARHVDDSIVREIKGKEQVLRRARGYAPLPIFIEDGKTSVLALGSHLKNTVSVSHGSKVFISQHIGDLGSQKSNEAFKKTIADFISIYEEKPEVVAFDKHPDYASSKLAKSLDLSKFSVQHHYAHILSCMADNQITSPVLGVSWDGSGFGDDGSLWGGEFLLVNDNSFERIAHFEKFGLPGSEVAIEESRRSALGLLYKVFGDKYFGKKSIKTFNSFEVVELKNICQMLANNINTPNTSSVGRLFDAVSSMLGICHKSKYEGQAAMQLEFAANGYKTAEFYTYDLQNDDNAIIIKYNKLLGSLINDLDEGCDVGMIAVKFHNTLVEIIVDIAKTVNINKVALSGGCFQNKYLTERAIDRLTTENFKVYWHQRVPPNDGGISLGQVLAAKREFKK
ncbi:MAG: carbamoyltransferase HypF [Candidatus Omnitrophica bacterium]|nr:carbamoyltransferase HypF [Candidatus Omnitrophota bacterium]MBU1996972.1 carbamoyltransferase HypF [Candidatus Omnitrophota bacterium]MBU4334394.1 carbamoyltransferase HypF [Candidatus Omnitrophota bacterium]